MAGKEMWEFRNDGSLTDVTFQVPTNMTDTSVTKIYDRYNYLDEKREALQQWADRLDDIVR